jgi:hypothetical protein
MAKTRLSNGRATIKLNEYGEALITTKRLDQYGDPIITTTTKYRSLADARIYIDNPDIIATMFGAPIPSTTGFEARAMSNPINDNPVIPFPSCKQKVG